MLDLDVMRTEEKTAAFYAPHCCIYGEGKHALVTTINSRLMVHSVHVGSLRSDSAETRFAPSVTRRRSRG